jgi:hypothetical protein
MGNSQPTTTTQIQKVELPAWVDNASQGNYQFAEQVANRPFEQYGGQQVADPSAASTWAANNLNNTADRTNGALAQAMANFGGLSQYQAQQVTAPGAVKDVATMGRAPDVSPMGRAPDVAYSTAAPAVGTFAPAAQVAAPQGYLGVQAPGAVANVAAAQGVRDVAGVNGYQAVQAPGAVDKVANAAGATPIAQAQGVADVAARSLPQTDLSGYLNPYTNNVVNTTLSGMRDNLALSAQKTDDAARGSGAWGSSRSGVQQAVLASQGAKDMAATEAGLRSAAFTNAQGAAQNDNQSALQAAMANQNSGLNTQAQNTARLQSNQNAELTTQNLNANIGKMNQDAALTTNAQGLDAAKTNASNFLANAGLAQDAQKANQNSALTTQALNADIGKANQQSALTTAQQGLAAGVANAGNYLQNAGLGLQAGIANQGSQNTNNALNAGILQGNQAITQQNNALNATIGANNQSSFNENNRLNAGILQGNQSSYNTNNALNAGILQGNQQSALTTNAQGLQAAGMNQQADLAAAGVRSNAAQGMASVGQAYSQAGTAQSALAAALGAHDEGLQQANLDVAKGQFDAAYNAPLDALNTRLAALGMSPYGKTTTSVGQQSGGTSSSPLSSILGGAMSILPMIFPSDRRLKTKVEKLGPTGAPGLNAYRYEYKDKVGAPKGQKYVGVMADEVKKAVPSALAKAKMGDGKTYDAVDYGKVAKHIASKRGILARAA